jgi:hypothetical protein
VRTGFMGSLHLVIVILVFTLELFSDYSSDVFAPLMWGPGQLPGWPTSSPAEVIHLYYVRDSR